MGPLGVRGLGVEDRGAPFAAVGEQDDVQLNAELETYLAVLAVSIHGSVPET